MAEGGGGPSGADIVGVASGVAGLIPAFIGRGQNQRLAQGFYGQPGYDKNAAFFGGQKGGLQAYTTQQQAGADAADARNAYLANYGRANVWDQAQAQARQGQQTLAQAQMARALGQTPSIAQMQADRQMQQAVAAQGAQQASARGAAGLALAGQVAAGNTANAQSSISGQAQVNAANERMAAEGAAQNAFGNIRTGDANAQATATQQAQFQAQQQQENRNANDQRAMQQQQYGLQARLGELNARTSNQGTLAGSNTTAQAVNQRSADQNAGSKGLIQTIGDFFSDERTKTPLLLMGGAPRRPDEAMPLMGAGSGAAAPSYEVLSGGGEDVAASGKAMSDFATKYGRDPVAEPTMYSDERAKRPLLARGRSYDTPLSPAEEADFQEWKKKYAPRDSGADYDLRGAFRAGLTPDGKTGHWEDTFKKPNHPTFSNQSQYADDEPAKAGAWDGEKYIPPSKLGMSRGGRGPRGEGVGDPDAPRVTFDPVRGWTREGDERPDPAVLQSAMQEQNARDIEDASINDQVEARRAQDARERTDPAVGLDRIARDRGMIRTPAPVDANAIADQEQGVAPGTNDFNATQPKADPGPGKRPWWMALGDASKTLNDAQFGTVPRGMVSDARAKEEAFNKGKSEGRSEVLDDVLAPFSGDEPSFVANKSTPVRAAYANFTPPTGKVINAVSDLRDAAKSNRPEQQAALDESRRAWFGRDSFEEPADGNPVADANRAMEGSAYAYKPAFTPPDQKPGEPNFGPMAQNMEKNPITATAVKTDPATGLKTIDRDKALKVTMAGLADLQRQNDTIMRLLPGRKVRK
jgi:hypothetical protein